MDDYELDLTGHQVGLMANPQHMQVAILFRQVTYQGTTPAVSSKPSRLGLTTDEAMRLLGAARCVSSRTPSSPGRDG
jgi:hypothetical protein